MAGDLALATNAPACPRCAQAMDPCTLEGHYGQRIATDVCPRCHLVWFDAFESVRLSGLGWVGLLRRMQSAPGGEVGPLPATLGCPRCSAPLKPVANLTRFGRFAALECPRQHGHLQTFTLLLAERGLVRPLAHGDLRTLHDEGRTACCLNCGAPLQGATERCSHCDSPLVAIDLPRLMTALLVRHAEALPAEAGERIAWACKGCGAPVEPTRDTRCASCHHPIVLPSVVDLRPLLDQVEPVLRAALPREARPHGQKLRELRGNAGATTWHRVMGHLSSLGDPEHRWPGIELPGWVSLALLGLLLAWLFW